MEKETLNFYMLEDQHDHGLQIASLLGRIVPDGCTRIRIAWVKRGSPVARNRRFREVFSAPLTLENQQYMWLEGSRKNAEWRFTEKASSGALEIVPWELEPDSKRFMPHAVILDIYIPSGAGRDYHATKTAYETTIDLFRGCGYPSDLVWTLSQKAGENKDYGHFFPKTWLAEIPELATYKDGVETTLSGILKRHLAKGTNLPSYLGKQAVKLYHDVLIPCSWRGRIQLQVDSMSVDKEKLERIWRGDKPVKRQAEYLWRIVDHPDRGNPSAQRLPAFTFFGQDIGLVEQAQYVTGAWYGLPANYLWVEKNGSGPIYREPEDVLQHSALQFKDPAVNVVLKRNLFVLLRMLIGPQTAFNALNDALPGFGLSAAMVNSMHLFGWNSKKNKDKTPDDWFKESFSNKTRIRTKTANA